MRDVVSLLDVLLNVVRSVSGVLLVICAVLAGLAWAVRARKVSPFGGVARFVRRVVEPMLTPVDRRLAGYGIVGPSVPWWALLLVLIACATLLFVLGFTRDALLTTWLAANAGPRGFLVLAVRTVIGTLQLALLVRIVTSWIGGTHSGVGRLATRLTEWFLAPLRRALPATAGIDLSPLIAWLILMVIQAGFLRIL